MEATGSLASSSHRGRVRQGAASARQEAGSPIREDRRLADEPPHTLSTRRPTRGGIESWLESRGLGKYVDRIIEATDAETLDDMTLIDAALAEEVITTVGLKLVTAKKFRDALEELRG